MLTRDQLEALVARYNQPAFIADDPVQFPHRYQHRPDQEISALFAATLAFGRRSMIVRQTDALLQRLGASPYEFIVNHTAKEAAALGDFVYRTFQPQDLAYFLRFLQHHYRQHASLEDAFSAHLSAQDTTVEPALVGFHRDFFHLAGSPQRTRKHLPSPEKKSTCKRLCLFLRWMVRRDAGGVDLGIWDKISPAQLVMPMDVHVQNIGRRYELLTRTQNDWKSALELTDALRKFDPTDPVKYDFALFGLGVSGESDTVDTNT